MFRFHVFPALLGLVSLDGAGRGGGGACHRGHSALISRPCSARWRAATSFPPAPASAAPSPRCRSRKAAAVKAGDVIAVVVDDKLALQLGAVDARIKALAGAARQRQDRSRPRRRSCLHGGVVAKTRVDQLQTQFDVLTNQLTAARGRPRRARAAAERGRGARPGARPRAHAFPSPRAP